MAATIKIDELSESTALNVKIKSSDLNKMIERAFHILDMLLEKDARLGINEITKACGIAPAVTARILKTMKESEWIFQSSDGRYLLSEKIHFVTEKDLLHLALQDTAYPIMQKCTDEYQQAMNLIVRDSEKCYILTQSRTNSIVDYIAPVNTPLPFYACASGKILMSELPAKLVELIISTTEMRPLTPYTITDSQKWQMELHRVSTQGYAFDHQESSLNGSCIAVPVRDNHGTIIAALSFSGFIGISDPENLLQFLPVLQDVSSKISKSLYADL